MKNLAYNGGTLTGNAEGNTVGSRENLFRREQSIIVGLMLGDGGMDRVSNSSARLSIKHGVQQKEYVYFLYHELQRLVRTPPKRTTELDKRFGTQTFRYCFRTVSSPYLLNYYHLFYDHNGKKKLPSNISSFVDDLVLSIWFMDDGSYKSDSKGLLINSNHFSIEEQRELQKILKENFGISTKLHKLRQWKRIYIPASESPKFSKIIYPHIISSLRYKLRKLSLTP